MENVSSVDVLLSWQPPEITGTPPFSNYTLVLNTTSGDERSFTFPSTENMTTILDLPPGTRYEAFISAISSLFSSEPSDPVNFTTDNTGKNHVIESDTCKILPNSLTIKNIKV